MIFERKRKIFRRSEGSMPPVPERPNATVGHMKTKQLRNRGHLCAFLQHTELLESCFLLNCQRCRKNSRKIKEVFKTDAKFIWSLDNLLNNPILFYQRRNKRQRLEVKVMQTQIRNMIINWLLQQHSHSSDAWKLEIAFRFTPPTTSISEVPISGVL